MRHLGKHSIPTLTLISVLPLFSLQDQEAGPSSAQQGRSNFERIVPYVPTPLDVVQKISARSVSCQRPRHSGR